MSRTRKVQRMMRDDAWSFARKMVQSWTKGLAVATLLAASAFLLPASAAQGASSKVTIEVFGDSLGYQAAPYLERDFSKGTSVNESHIYPGTALCTWLPAIKALSASTAPTVAVLEFVGNVSSCDGSVTSPTALAAAYLADLKTAIGDLLDAGVRFIVVDEGPRVRCTAYAYCKAQPDLHSAFEKAVAHFSSPAVIYAGKADRAVETPAGKFTTTLPCLSSEVRAKLCARGAQILVRAPDGIHFCPVAHSAALPCPVYASGAYRFANGFARTVWSLERATRPASGATTP